MKISQNNEDPHSAYCPVSYSGEPGKQSDLTTASGRVKHTRTSELVLIITVTCTFIVQFCRVVLSTCSFKILKSNENWNKCKSKFNLIIMFTNFSIHLAKRRRCMCYLRAEKGVKFTD